MIRLLVLVLALSSALAAPAMAQDKLRVVASFSIPADFARQTGAHQVTAR